jgi:integrase
MIGLLNGDSRDIPLSRRAVAILKELASDKGRDADRVFPLTGNSICLAFEHLRVRAGMDDFRFHDLRHEGVSRLFEKGLNIDAGHVGERPRSRKRR